MVPFLDLKAQYAGIKDEINAAILRVVESTQFILGNDVAAFEEEFAAFCTVNNCVALNSGTSALHLALLALDVGPGDEVITVSSTFIATAAAICYTGATPVFVDVDPQSWTMDADAFEQAITPKTKAVIPVHLHGRMANMTKICTVAESHGVTVVEDAAQAHGATHKAAVAGTFGAIGCFSFYPGKNLGAYGEGGAVVTQDDELAHRIRVMRDWGQEKKYHHTVTGFNARMDSIQGAVLRVKLRYLEDWTNKRRLHAKRYHELLANIPVDRPQMSTEDRHVFHIYSIVTANRDNVQMALNAAGIGTNIHYPIPVHRQAVYAKLGYEVETLPVTERLAAGFLSLPIYAELEDRDLENVAETLRSVVNV